MLAYPFEGIFIKIPTRKPLTELVFFPDKPRTFTALVIGHFHLIGTPVFAQILLITLKSQGLKQGLFAIIKNDLLRIEVFFIEPHHLTGVARIFIGRITLNHIAVNVGWVEERNPPFLNLHHNNSIIIRLQVGFTSFYPPYACSIIKFLDLLV